MTSCTARGTRSYGNRVDRELCPGAHALSFNRQVEANARMSEPVFIMGLSIAAITLIVMVRSIAGAIAGGGSSRSELAQIKQRLEEHAAALEDAQTTVTNQSTQLAELQERLDFAERLLAQSKDRSALGAGEKRG